MHRQTQHRERHTTCKWMVNDKVCETTRWIKLVHRLSFQLIKASFFLIEESFRCSSLVLNVDCGCVDAEEFSFYFKSLFHAFLPIFLNECYRPNSDLSLFISLSLNFRYFFFLFANSNSEHQSFFICCF